MQAVIDSKKQLDELGTLLEDMKSYLSRVEQGCQELPMCLQVGDKFKPLETLTQIMEGLSYYQKLIKSAAVLLAVDFSEILCDEMSISSLFDHLGQIFANIFEAAENEDYSLLTDIIEYDLMPAICSSQGILVVVQGRCEERVM
ncbi:MAG: hypothetical protein H6Q69_563 [Firmicutes bacterium]|nr:hypothetical protein [Bacillota bacterium]